MPYPPFLLLLITTALPYPLPPTLLLNRLASFPYTQSLDVVVGVAAYLCRQPQALHKVGSYCLTRAAMILLLFDWAVLISTELY